MNPLPFQPAPPGTPAGEAAGAALVAAVILALLAAAELWHRRGAPAEWSRKLVHVGAGALALSLPWLLAGPLTVALLGGGFAGLLLFTRRAGWLNGVHGIERRSQGSLYYPLAITLLFWLGREEPVFYLIAVLVLVVSDSCAALFGTAYGRWRYHAERERRSFEGSIAFFLTAFFCVHLPLLLLTDLDRTACVLVALQLALLVTCFEAISLGGNDNLIVPLAAYFLLVKLTGQEVGALALGFSVQLGILLLTALVAWRWRLLTVSGALATHLFFYGAWALAGPHWVIAPALALAGFVAARAWLQKERGLPSAAYQVSAVFYVAAASAALYLLAAFLPAPAGASLYAPYVGALAGQLGILLAAPGGRPRGLGETLAAGTGAFLLVAPAGLWLGAAGVPSPDAIGTLAVAAAICAAGLAFYSGARRLAWWPGAPLWDLRLQAASVTLACLAAAPLYWG